MNSMLATDTNEKPVEPQALAPAPLPPLETQAHNDPMGHIPTVDWMVGKLGGDILRRVDLLLEVFHAMPHDDPRHAGVEGPLRLLCRSLDRLAEAARHGRANHPPHEIGAHIHWSLEHAVANLRALDPATFGRREPYHHFDRSRAEPVYGALLAVLAAIERTIEIARVVDPSLDERLYAHLVNLETPMRPEPMA